MIQFKTMLNASLMLLFKKKKNNYPILWDGHQISRSFFVFSCQRRHDHTIKLGIKDLHKAYKNSEQEKIIYNNNLFYQRA